MRENGGMLNLATVSAALDFAKQLAKAWPEEQMVSSTTEIAPIVLRRLGFDPHDRYANTDDMKAINHLTSEMVIGAGIHGVNERAGGRTVRINTCLRLAVLEMEAQADRAGKTATGRTRV